MITVTVEGAGTLVGLESGNVRDTQSYALPYRKAHGGRLAAYVRSTSSPGAIVIRASAAGLTSAEVALQSVSAAKP
jgi:beta-galactosidase